MIPLQVQVFCYSCRSETMHLLTKAPLYRCEKNCGSPWRHISDPNERTPEAIKNKRDAELALVDYFTKENEATMAFFKSSQKAAATSRRKHGLRGR